MDASAEQAAEILGPRIRRVRRRQEMSQELLADGAGIHRTQITVIEHSHRLPRVDTVIRLAAGLGVTACDLLDGIEWETHGGGSGRVVERGREAAMPEIGDPTRSFAANMRRLRKVAGLSQGEVAFRAAIHPTQVSLLESGNRLPRFDTLIKLAGSLDATPNDLTDGIVWDPIVAVAGGLVVTSPEGDEDD